MESIGDSSAPEPFPWLGPIPPPVEVNELREAAEKKSREIIDAGILNCRWYAHPDDLIGGWCVMPVDEDAPGTTLPGGVVTSTGLYVRPPVVVGDGSGDPGGTSGWVGPPRRFHRIRRAAPRCLSICPTLLVH